MGFGERAAKDRKILSKDVDSSPPDLPIPGDDAIAGDLLQGKISSAVDHEWIEFDEGALVQEDFQALACGELARSVLALDAVWATAQAGLLAPALQGPQTILHENLLTLILTDRAMGEQARRRRAGRPGGVAPALRNGRVATTMSRWGKIPAPEARRGAKPWRPMPTASGGRLEHPKEVSQ
ncbi:hypothetical protein HRbin07_00560 [bacterium HR07]|nr:hypothetical protein HRbin07_00560 [bacterium HR07]